MLVIPALVTMHHQTQCHRIILGSKGISMQNRGKREVNKIMNPEKRNYDGNEIETVLHDRKWGRCGRGIMLRNPMKRKRRK